MDAKINLYFDIDDTILRSSETVINIINKRYHINKSINDLKEWNYKSIYPALTTEEVFDIYDSNEFFNSVKIEPAFQSWYNEHKKNFNFYFVSKGKAQNINCKQALINKHFPNATFFPCMFEPQKINFDKSHIDMSYGIQIDDRWDCLKTTNATCKILLKNNRDYPWNIPDDVVDNLYIVNNWNQVLDILNFAYKNPDLFMRRGY